MLGWSAEAALTTPIPHLQLAVDGAVEWEMRRNGKEPEESQAQAEPPDAETTMSEIKRLFRGVGAKGKKRQKGRRKVSGR